MKKTSSHLRILLVIICLATIFTSQEICAQDMEKQEKENAKIEALKKNIEAGTYVFVAQSATPMSARTRQLTSTYELRMNKDTVDVDLPYFGRAYTATYGSTEGGIHFTTTQFVYSEKDGKKGGWDIIIDPKNQPTAQRIILNISNSGYGTLQVTSNTRQMISFYGYIKELK